MPKGIKNDNIASDSGKDKLQKSLSYPVDTIAHALEQVKILADKRSTDKAISKDDIGKILDRGVSTLTLYLSSWCQYGILKNERGQGYRVTEVFDRYIKGNPGERYRTMKDMFQAPTLYKKLITTYSGKELPDQNEFAKTLTEEPYFIYASSAVKATEVFFENSKELSFFNPLTNLFAIHSHRQNMGVPGSDTDSDVDYLPVSIPLCSGNILNLKFPWPLQKKDIANIVSVISGYEGAALPEMDPHVGK